MCAYGCKIDLKSYSSICSATAMATAKCQSDTSKHAIWWLRGFVNLIIRCPIRYWITLQVHDIADSALVQVIIAKTWFWHPLWNMQNTTYRLSCTNVIAADGLATEEAKASATRVLYLITGKFLSSPKLGWIIQDEWKYMQYSKQCFSRDVDTWLKSLRYTDKHNLCILNNGTHT